MRAYHFLLVDKSSGWTAIDNAVFYLLMSLCIPQIFAVKVKSCPKSQQILDVFAFPNFKGAGPTKVVPALSRLPSNTSGGRASWS